MIGPALGGYLSASLGNGITSQLRPASDDGGAFGEAVRLELYGAGPLLGDLEVLPGAAAHDLGARSADEVLIHEAIEGPVQRAGGQLDPALGHLVPSICRVSRPPTGPA